MLSLIVIMVLGGIEMSELIKWNILQINIESLMYFDFISIMFKMGKCRIGASVIDNRKWNYRLSKLMLDHHPPATQSQTAGSLLPEGEPPAQWLAVWSQGPCLVCVCVHLITKVHFSVYPWQWGREHLVPWEGSSSTAVCSGCKVCSRNLWSMCVTSVV